MTQQGYTIEELSVGQSADFTKTVTEDVIEKFAEVSGDTNPVHMDAAYAATTPFKERIAHGILSASFISAVLGTLLPGPGAIFMSQSIRFRAPVKIGDTVTARCTVTEVITEKKRVKLACECKVGDTVVVDGEAMLMVPSKEA